MTDQRAGEDLIADAADAAREAWTAEWNLNPQVITQAGESFKRRFYAQAIIDFLRSLPVEERMDAMGMRRSSAGHGLWREDR